MSHIQYIGGRCLDSGQGREEIQRERKDSGGVIDSVKWRWRGESWWEEKEQEYYFTLKHNYRYVPGTLSPSSSFCVWLGNNKKRREKGCLYSSTTIFKLSSSVKKRESERERVTVREREVILSGEMTILFQKNHHKKKMRGKIKKKRKSFIHSHSFIHSWTIIPIILM